jgi:hypothetical protein
VTANAEPARPAGPRAPLNDTDRRAITVAWLGMLAGELMLMRRCAAPGNVLCYLRRTSTGGAVEYAAQFLDGLIHPGLVRSGATPAEQHRPLPGDDLVPHPR